jgi:hypothetical protein
MSYRCNALVSASTAATPASVVVSASQVPDLFGATAHRCEVTTAPLDVVPVASAAASKQRPFDSFRRQHHLRHATTHSSVLSDPSLTLSLPYTLIHSFSHSIATVFTCCCSCRYPRHSQLPLPLSRPPSPAPALYCCCCCFCYYSRRHSRRLVQLLLLLLLQPSRTTSVPAAATAICVISSF